MKKEKFCPHCEETKPVSEFAKNKARHDGLQSWCKVCLYALNKRNSPRYREHNRAYAEERRKDPEFRNREIIRKREARLDPKQREHDRQYSRDYYRRKNPRWKKPKLMSQAHTAVWGAIRRGDLPKPDTLQCSWPDCSDMAKHYHHKSYEPEHWFDIEPLCTIHHGLTHQLELTN